MIPLVLGGVMLLVAIHVAVTYLASERLNVFAALCILSMLPAVAVAVLAAVAALAVTHDRRGAAAWAAACFVVLVLPYTGQGLWELIARMRGRSAARPSQHRDPTRRSIATKSKSGERPNS
jgi:hypothetical protein